MSLHHDIMKEGDTYQYAFLVAQTASILKKPEDSPLADSEIEKLKWARDFVRNLASGTELLTNKERWSFASYESIRALSFVLNPIESLQRFMQAEVSQQGEASEFGAFLEQVKGYLDDIVASKRLIPGKEKKFADDFFRWLSISLVESVSQSPSQRMVIDRIEKPR